MVRNANIDDTNYPSYYQAVDDATQFMSVKLNWLTAVVDVEMRLIHGNGEEAVLTFFRRCLL